MRWKVKVLKRLLLLLALFMIRPYLGLKLLNSFCWQRIKKWKCDLKEKWATHSQKEEQKLVFKGALF